MIRGQTLCSLQKQVGKLPITGEVLRGSLLERTVRHTKDCPKCARGEGDRVFVLTVRYGEGRVRSEDDEFELKKHDDDPDRRLLPSISILLRMAVLGVVA